jgi:hypothetical protein
MAEIGISSRNGRGSKISRVGLVTHKIFWPWAGTNMEIIISIHSTDGE